MTAELPVTQATLDAAVELAARGLWDAATYTDDDTSWEHLTNPMVREQVRDEARAAFTAALPVLAAAIEQARADERERGAAALRQLLVEHLLVSGKCYPSVCGDPYDIVWPDHIAEQWLAALDPTTTT